MSTATNPERIHVGHNIKRYREMVGIKQQAMATGLGEGWSQKMISQLEEKEEIEDDILEKVAKILKIPMETLKYHPAEHVMVNIQNTFEGPINNEGTQSSASSNENTYNSANELTEVLAKIIEMHEENKVLYERIIKEKEEMIALLMKGK